MVADRKWTKTTLLGKRIEFDFSQRPNWNLEVFLNGEENYGESRKSFQELIDNDGEISDIQKISHFPGIIRYDIFGVGEKRIDFGYFEKKWFGKYPSQGALVE